MDEVEGHGGRSYAIGAGVFAAARIAGSAAGAVTLVLLTQVLDKDALGGYALAASLLLPLAVAGSLGLDRAILFRISPVARSPGSMNGAGLALGALGLSAAGGALAGAAVWAAGPALLPASATATDWLPAVALAAPFAAATIVARAWLEANDAAPLGNTLPALTDIGRCLAVAAVAALGLGAAGVGAAVVLSAALPLAVPGVVASRRRLVRAPRRLRRADLAAGARHMPMRLCVVGSRTVDVVIAGLLLAPAATADYAVASRLAAFVDLAYGALMPTFQPRARRQLHAGRPDLAEREFLTARIAALLAGMAALSGLLLAGPAALALLGDFEGALAPLLLIGAGQVVRVGAGHHLPYLAMRGDLGLPLALQVGGLALTIALVAGLALVWGVVGAAAGSLVATSVTAVAGAVLTGRRAGFATVDLPVGLSVSASLALASAAASGLLAPAPAGLALCAATLVLAAINRARLRAWAAELATPRRRRA